MATTSTVLSSAAIAPAALRQTLRRIEPAALLVEPRIMRRVIRMDRRLAGLGLFVPHRNCYTIDRDRLLAYVDRSELDLPPGADLPQTAILLARHAEDENADAADVDDVLRRYWRLLFHAQVHVELDRRIAVHLSPAELAAQRRLQIGEIEFAEARSILLKDEYLFPKPTDLETYVEFVAVYLELHYFAAHDLPHYFPAIRDWQAIERMVSADVSHAKLFELSRPAEISAYERDEADGPETIPAASGHAASPEAMPSPGRSEKMIARADRAAAVGNAVKSAILKTRAAAMAAPHRAIELHRAADHDMDLLASRLKQALALTDDERAQFNGALVALLEPAAAGVWSVEARLLYDLQKACIEQERGVFKLDLIEWLRSRGRRGVQRPLPLLREVLIVKHLRTAQRRLGRADVLPAVRERLSALTAAALVRVELRLRDRMRPRIVQALDDVDLLPHDVPEQVARHKLVEELLDRIVDHGYLNMGDVRDSLSKNDLKLPDLAGVGELAHGDRLLRVDRKLGEVLDGVYRPGTVYLRWPQRLSSVAFGTRVGRFLTQYVAIPFGGAFLVLFFIRYEIARLMFGKAASDQAPVPDATLALREHYPIAGSWWALWAVVLLTGIWILLLIHHPPFRAWCRDMLWHGWHALRRVVVDLPAGVLHSPLVQRILHSAAYAALGSYVVRPLLLTLFISLVPWCFGYRWSQRTMLDVFFLMALALNSPIGRFVDEWLTDLLGRVWYELRMRVFAALFQLIMDAFHTLMVGLERVMYTVDEWLRFRVGDQRASRAMKLVAGTGWFFVSYVILFVFTLLVEPQVNPIKHFPVVTVSHKLVALVGPMFVTQLTPWLGKTRANTLVWSTIWLIPGVFGFLVWELRENWRLYAANRSKSLRAVPVGHHGETMIRLLRPGFHSGTLPKQYAKLRRALAKAEHSGDRRALVGKETAIAHVAEAVRHFVEREFIALVEEAGVLGEDRLSVKQVRTATNRIDVEISSAKHPGENAWLIWEEDAGQLTMTISQPGWLASLSHDQRESVIVALSGLAQRSGADETRGPWCGTIVPPCSWHDWVGIWSPAEEQAQSDDTPPHLRLLRA
ncbi:MAG: hypothetical protein K8T25_21290 [Planctomycetia bacterium]|nr:hypothetical protein [Planctomycetia bacterium]